MLPFKTLIVLQDDRIVAVYQQIANSFTALIQSGVIRPGTFLPSSRELAILLEVHRQTIVAAYDELISQGWIESLPRKGIRVPADLPVIKPKSFYGKDRHTSYAGLAKFPFRTGIPGLRTSASVVPGSSIIVNDGFPDVGLAPFDSMIKEYRRLMQGTQLTRLMAVPDFGGSHSLKNAAPAFLNDSRALNISAENILITRGAQMAIYLAAAMILKPGDQVIVSDPGYYIADAVFAQMGARLIKIPVDNEGMDVDEVERILKETKISLLYVIPHHHHPTTVTMSSSRRTKLLELIRTYQLPTIEDDYDYDFHYENSPVLPLASANHDGNVIYIGSFTKLLAPSFRIGYLIAPSNFIDQAVNLKRLIDLRGDTMMEEALSVIITNGELSRHIKKTKKVYSRRCELISELVNSKLNHAVDFIKPQGGLAIWLKFKKEYPVKEVIAAAAKAGVMLTGSFYDGENGVNHNGLRFGFASLNEKEMETVIEVLVKVIGEIKLKAARSV